MSVQPSLQWTGLCPEGKQRDYFSLVMSKAKLSDARSPLDDFPLPDELDDGEEAGKYRDKGDSSHEH